MIAGPAMIGKTTVRMKVVDSTNEKAKEMLDDVLEEGTVIVAERQAAGRGRYGRAWSSPPGGIYISIVLKPSERNVQLLSLLSGLPVVRTLRLHGVDARLKWPNDVMVGEKKIAGILCEGVHRRDSFWAIVGIGINTAPDLGRLPPDVRTEATSIKNETSQDVDNDRFVERLLAEYDAFYAAYRSGETTRLLAEYRGICATLGKSVVIETAKGRVKGTARDVTALGALVVEDAGKRVEVFEGTVSGCR